MKPHISKGKGERRSSKVLSQPQAPAPRDVADTANRGASHAAPAELAALVYTPKQVEPILQLSKNTVNALLNSGELRAVRCGRKWLIPRDAITEFLARGAR